MQTKLSKYLSGLLLLLVLLAATAAWAGPFEDARDAGRRGDNRAALQILETADQSGSNDPRVYAAMGKLYRGQGNDAAALEAYRKFVALDPKLSTLRASDRPKFLRAFREIGGTLPAPSGSLSGDEAGDLINALTTGNVYVHPDLKGEVNAAELAAAAAQAPADTPVKIVAVPKIGQYPSREALAADLRERLNLGEGVVVVGTPKGISASSGRLGADQIKDALKRANLDAAFRQGGLTQALATAAMAASGKVVSDRRTDSNWLTTLMLLGGGGIVGFLAIRSAKKKAQMDRAKRPIITLQKQTVEHLSYVDGYLDLLPETADAEQAKKLRATAYDEYATAKGILETAKEPSDVRRAQPMLEHALTQLEECRVLIDKATGGTGVAMAVPTIPSLETDAERAERLKSVEQITSESERDQMQRSLSEIPASERGVSFFSGRPMPMKDLVPVTIVIGGQKREVMATRDEAEQIRRGETPQIRAFEEDGRYVPWYENRGYDPYRDYYGGWGRGGGFGSLVDLYILTHLFGGGLFGGYGPWGGYGYGPVIVNNYGDNYGGGMFGGDGNAVPQEVEHAGGFDFFGQQDYDEQGSGFGFGDGDGGGGGFDLGDFGGGDGGGFDFGDFGGGDW